MGVGAHNSLPVKRIFSRHSHRGVLWSGEKNPPPSQVGVGVGRKTPHPQMGEVKTLLAKVRGGGPMAHGGANPYPFPFEVV